MVILLANRNVSVPGSQIREIFNMYPLTVQGVEELAKDLSKG